MAIRITLSEETAQHLIQCVTPLIATEEMNGRDVSHYQALLTSLLDAMSLDCNSDEIDPSSMFESDCDADATASGASLSTVQFSPVFGVPLPFHACNAVAHGDGTLDNPEHHNGNLEYTLSPIHPPLSPFDSTGSDFEDETTLYDAPSSPLKLPFAVASFNTAILDPAGGAIAHDDDSQSDRDLEYPLSHLQPSSSFLNAIVSDWEEGTVFGTSSSPLMPSQVFDSFGGAVHDLDPPAPQCIHLLDDDSADAPPAKRAHVSVPDDNYDPDDSDGSVVHADKCKRKGDKKRKKTSQRKKGSSRGCMSKGTKRVVTWTDSLTLPPPSLNSLQLLTRLSTVSSEQ
ncbi:hypothetical protein EV421DRAFT_1907444 [Armillaria borealis]|uniref:Uncharacterized protein n=1 Tax=Armillaria borealis TaxID=47425 RepID=A0AA39J6Q1_9AGAR|nr:hypothetical protein EV421DRAFT_1907444 [Armillaria borealis]